MIELGITTDKKGLFPLESCKLSQANEAAHTTRLTGESAGEFSVVKSQHAPRHNKIAGGS